MRFFLVPIGNGRNVIARWLIRAIRIPSQILNCHFQIPVKLDRVHQVPSVEAVLRRTSIGFDTLWIEHVANVGGRIERRKIIVSTEVVFRAGAYDGRKFTVPVQVEFYFSLAKPSADQLGPSQKCSHVATCSFDSIEDRIDRIGPLHGGSAPLGVKIAGFSRHAAQAIINLIRENLPWFV